MARDSLTPKPLTPAASQSNCSVRAFREEAALTGPCAVRPCGSAAFCEPAPLLQAQPTGLCTLAPPSRLQETPNVEALLRSRLANAAGRPCCRLLPEKPRQAWLLGCAEPTLQVRALVRDCPLRDRQPPVCKSLAGGIRNAGEDGGGRLGSLRHFLCALSHLGLLVSIGGGGTGAGVNTRYS